MGPNNVTNQNVESTRVSGVPRAWHAWSAWIAMGTLFLAAAMTLNLSSGAFGTGVRFEDMPAIPLTVGLIAVGCLYLCLIPLILTSLRLNIHSSNKLFWLIVAFGLAFRLAFFGATPAFEDDWYRYLWDGGVTANGWNPYAVSPDEAQGEAYHYSLQPLAHQSGVVIEGINHSEVRTIYPPVAQMAFALAHMIEPWSLDAWRLVCLTAEIATLVLLLALLKHAARPALWVALYWWNPIVVKELMNSAHMDAILIPFVLGALLLSLRGYALGAATSLGVAIGVKVWPVLLAPLLLRPLFSEPRRLIAAVAIFAALCTLWAIPILAAGVDKTSGFVVYAQYWRNSSAHYGLMEAATRAFLSFRDFAPETPGLIVKGLLAGCAGLIALFAARAPIESPRDLLYRAGLVTAALFLLSPSQFPWYAVWMLPFVVYRPWVGLLAVTALIPIYYISFHFAAHDAYDVYRSKIVWLIWLPVWTLVVWEGVRIYRGAGPLIPDQVDPDHA